jgi:hypothetical protein
MVSNRSGRHKSCYHNFFAFLGKKELKGFFYCLNIAMFSNDFTPKNPQNFICEVCDFITSNKKDFKRLQFFLKTNFKSKLFPHKNKTI